MTRDRDQQPKRYASADDAFLEVTVARAKARRTRGRARTEAAGSEAEQEADADAAGSEVSESGAARRSGATGHEAGTGEAGTDEGGTGEARRGEGRAGEAGAEGREPRPDDQESPASTSPDISSEEVRDHLRRRAIFLRELAEARELRERVTPHRARRARIHAALRRRTFRLH
ncbi:hypothetical protein [Actinomadura sp. 9N407]|uniref:hypothetical protein n=1 Tax=Actinomadura sp. 9N407 TaxID=3375154 RepID=UPI0037BC0F6B